jgi:replicative DNA helicase
MLNSKPNSLTNIHSDAAFQIECLILGALINNSNRWDDISDKLKEEYFSSHRHQKIFHAMQALTNKAKPLDLITLELELAESGELEAVGGFHYLSSLAYSSCGSSNLKLYVEEIARQFVLRRLQDIGDEIASTAKNPAGKTAEELCNMFEEKIFGIKESSNQREGSQSISDAMAELLDSLEGDTARPLETGFTELDDLMCGGMRPGELIIIAGRPGSGKTTLGINIAEHVGFVLNKGVLIFTLEMPTLQLMQRMMASQGKVNFNKLRMKHKYPFVEADWTKISRGITAMKSDVFRIDSTRKITCSTLRARARRDKRQMRDLSLIVVDYLQLVSSDNHYENKVSEITEVSGALKSLALELNIPIIALSQLNRNSLNRAGGDKRPTMGELRGSGSIEQDADVVALIHRAEMFDATPHNKGLTEIIVDKQRNGETGVFKLSFQGQYSSFMNYKDYTV